LTAGPGARGAAADGRVQVT